MLFTFILTTLFLLPSIVLAGFERTHSRQLRHHRVPSQISRRAKTCRQRPSTDGKNNNATESIVPPPPPASTPAPAPPAQNNNQNSKPDTNFSGCFPASGNTPDSVPSSTKGWWCDQNSEYGFAGFSYSVAGCQSASQLKQEFTDIRKRFGGQYVRIYGTCDKKGFYNDVIEAAWSAKIGVHSLIWFGFDGSNAWQSRRDSLFSTLKSNPKAKFVVRSVQFGSEPLFDHVISPSELVKQVKGAQKELSGLGILVTVSEMSYGIQQQQNSGSLDVLRAVDFAGAHMLPFFSGSASTGKNAWSIVNNDLKWWTSNAPGKKIVLTQNGWPSQTSSNVKPNSGAAVANVQNEQDYYDMLDAHCEDMKRLKVSWMAHLYSESQGVGYGIIGSDGKLKFPFKPRSSC